MNPGTGARRGLSRQLGLLDATMIVVSGIIGGGIFFTPSVVAQHLPHEGWILAVWGAGAAIAVAGGLVFAELGARFPDAGGHYVYIRDAFGRLPAFLFGWVLLLIISSGALASLAIAFAAYLSVFTPMDAGVQKAVALGTVLALTGINVLGVRVGSRTITGITLLKIASLAVLVAAGLLVADAAGDVARATGAAAAAAGDDSPPARSLAWALGGALVPVLFSFGGWQNLNFVAGEVAEPQRRVPRAILLGVLIVAASYMGANLVYLKGLGAAGMAASDRVAADAAQALFGPVGARLVTAAVALSILGIANVVVMATPRVYFALARDGLFFPSLARVHPRLGTPARAIALQGGWSALLVMVGSLGPLVTGVVFADWIFFGLGAASLFVYRRRHGADAPFRTPGYPWVPLFFIAAAVVAVGSAIAAYPRESLLGAGLLAVGAGVYAVRMREGAGARAAAGSGSS